MVDSGPLLGPDPPERRECAIRHELTAQLENTPSRVVMAYPESKTCCLLGILNQSRFKLLETRAERH